MKKTINCLTGKDLKKYREETGLSQRRFAYRFDFKRGTLATYEWSGKKLPGWIVSKMLRFDPNFELCCAILRDASKTEHLKYHYETPFKKKNWFERLINWLMGC